MLFSCLFQCLTVYQRPANNGEMVASKRHNHPSQLDVETCVRKHDRGRDLRRDKEDQKSRGKEVNQHLYSTGISRETYKRSIVTWFSQLIC